MDNVSTPSLEDLPNVTISSSPLLSTLSSISDNISNTSTSLSSLHDNTTTSLSDNVSNITTLSSLADTVTANLSLLSSTVSELTNISHTSAFPYLNSTLLSSTHSLPPSSTTPVVTTSTTSLVPITPQSFGPRLSTVKGLSGLLSVSCTETAPPPEEPIFHLAHLLLLLAYLAPHTHFGKKWYCIKHGQLFLHSGAVLGFLLLSAWAWTFVCAADVFAWYFILVLLNMGQFFYVIYHGRTHHFHPELEDIYTGMFQPLRITRLQFKNLVSPELAQIFPLHPGECYALANHTKTNRLALLISGQVTVVSEKGVLHNISEHEFLDSPEFESSAPPKYDETFKVTICALAPSRYIVWNRTGLEYLFAKDPRLGTVMAGMVSSDVTNKLYSMNSQLKMEDGDLVTMDIRLPGIAGRLSQMDSRDLSEFTDHQGSKSVNIIRTLVRAKSRERSAHLNSTRDVLWKTLSGNVENEL